MTLSSGDITAESIVAQKGSFVSSSGSMELTNIDIDALDLTLSSGDVKLYGFKGKLKGNMSSGSVDFIAQELSGDIILELSSGDAKIEFAEQNLNAELELRTGSGDIEVNFPVLTTNTQKEDTLYGTAGNGGYNINIKTSSGDISIN